MDAMLSLLSRTTSRFLDVRFDPSDSHYSDEDVLIVDLDALRDLVPARPNIPWRRVVGACEQTLFPMYRKLHDTLHHDVDHLTHLFSEIGSSVTEDSAQKLEEISVATTLSDNLAFSDTSKTSTSRASSYRKRRRSSHSGVTEILVIQSSHPSVPTIVITLCPSQPYDSRSWVPCQDACFGSRLLVPNHLAVNDVFPPLVAESLPASLKPVENWQYTNGHWCAILPTLEEQARRGLSSKVVPVRRKVGRRGVSSARSLRCNDPSRL